MADDLEDPEFDKWRFDDDFVRGGRHEPTARTRAAIARHSGERTSWRQPGAPVDERPPRRRRRRQPRRRIAWSRTIVGSLLLTALVSLGIWIVASRNDTSSSPVVASSEPVATIAPDSGKSATATGGRYARDDNEVTGINEATSIGTCFSTPTAQNRAAYRGSLSLREVACSAPHTYELVAHESASGGAAYPADSYWDGPVARSCAQAFVRYAGARAHGAPSVDGRQSGYFTPRRDGWAEGDRAVYCVARSSVPHTASVRG